jgi:hypothetical protein
MKRANYTNPGKAYARALDAEREAAKKLRRAFHRWELARRALNRADAKLDQLALTDAEQEDQPS